MSKLSKVAGTVLGSTALAAIPTISEADVEPLNNTFPGEPATVGTAMSGVISSNGTDAIDLFSYTGLPAGSAFDLTADRVDVFSPSGTIHAGRYTSQTAVVDSVDVAPGGTGHLTGTVPGTGALSFGLTITPQGLFTEGYHITLNVTPPTAVPEPASLVLLATGLTGLYIARRRRGQ